MWIPPLICSYAVWIFLSIQLFYTIHRYPKYWDTLPAYYTFPKIWNSPLYYLLMCLKYCCMFGKQWRPWPDPALWFCGIRSGPTQFAKAYLSQYLGLYGKHSFIMQPMSKFSKYISGKCRKHAKQITTNGLHQAKKCLRACAKCVNSHHPANEQCLIQVFAFHWYIL